MALTTDREATAAELNSAWSYIMQQCQAKLPNAIRDPNGDGTKIFIGQEMYEDDPATRNIGNITDLALMLCVFGERWGYGSWHMLEMEEGSRLVVGVFSRSSRNRSTYQIGEDGAHSVSALQSPVLVGKIFIEYDGSAYKYGGNRIDSDTFDGNKSLSIVGGIESFSDTGIDNWSLFLEELEQVGQNESEFIEYFYQKRGLDEWCPPIFSVDLGQIERWSGYPETVAADRKKFTDFTTVNVSAQADGTNKAFSIPTDFQSGSVVAYINGIRYLTGDFVTDASDPTLTFNVITPNSDDTVIIQYAPA